MSFHSFRDPIVGEEVLLARTSRGLSVRVLPRPRLREAAAVITFHYGSIDLAFDRDGIRTESPAGTAHYLEHKLFEDEELAVFQRFAARGARVNAQTGFARTTYFFQCAQQFGDNLRDLLRLVSRPHITDENVEKERGIIAQEVRMYEDSPDQGAAFSLLSAMYAQHPARLTVGGTVESIGRITKATLLDAYAAFYRTGNASLAVAGPVDPDEVLRLAEACELAEGSAPSRADIADFAPVASSRIERSLSVARPKALLGLKERERADTAFARSRRATATGVVLDRLFAGSSDLRERMQLRRLRLVREERVLQQYHEGCEQVPRPMRRRQRERPERRATPLQRRWLRGLVVQRGAHRSNELLHRVLERGQHSGCCRKGLE
jgi:predicted Zn-dependent peptidase